MELDLSPGILLTTSGIGIATAVFLQLIVKPALKSYEDRAWYPFSLNLHALLVAIFFGLASYAIFEDEYTTSRVLWAMVQGVFAAFFAVYGYEAYSNINKWVVGRPKE